ncbi:MAG: aminodeoxychorismate synthase component I [Phycisphaerales bacterium]
MHCDLDPLEGAPRVCLSCPHAVQPLSLGASTHSSILPRQPGLFWLGYELGRFLEPAVAVSDAPANDRGWGLGEFHHCSWVLQTDPSGTSRRIEGDVADATATLRRCTRHAGAYRLELHDPQAARRAFERGVRRVLSYIRAGDVYQVNLTHRLTGRLIGCPRAFAADLLASACPWHGAYLESEDHSGRRRAIVSASPELFIRFDAPSRHVQTRPMKGTRPIASSEAELASSAKDRAELNMIIDLMRNDLGRVCRLGSVRVASAFNLEHHADSVLQSTATVCGSLNAGVHACELLRATFPPGSVTGAPKIRAMQIIEELEPVARGPYCGSIGRQSPDGSLAMNVAIRTALLTETDRPGEWLLDFPVGAGIVADSDPEQEWNETLTKAQVLFRLTQTQAHPAHR